MSQSAATLLSKTEDAIAGLLDAIASPNVEEYQIGSRRVRRPDFARTLQSLEAVRAIYQRRVNRSNTSPLRAVKIGRPRAVDR